MFLRSFAALSFEQTNPILSDNSVSFKKRDGTNQQIIAERNSQGVLTVTQLSNGKLESTCTFEKVDDDHVLYTISTGNSTKQTLVTVSDYVTHVHSADTSSTRSISNSFFRGTIFYHPKVHNGVSYERTLGINYELTSGSYDIYTINGKIGATVSFIAGLIIAAFLAPLTLPWLVSFLISALGSFVVDGVIVAAFTEDVFSYNSYYTIYATNVVMGHTTEHTGSAHEVDMPGRRNEYYFHGGYLPFGDSNAAYNLFQAHWPNDWTGLDRFYSAYPSMVI